MKKATGFLILFAALVLGFGVGLFIAWEIAPVKFIDTTPSSLRIDFKDEYRSLIAAAYHTTGNLPRAQVRLATLGDADPSSALAEQAQRMLDNNASAQAIQALASLSESLQANPAATSNPTQPANSGTTQLPAQTPSPGATQNTQKISTATAIATDAPTRTSSEILATEPGNATAIPSPLATLPPPPKPTATFTPVPGFELVKQSSLCDASQPGLLQVYLSDATGKPTAGIELIITWFGGEEHFFSGFKPEISSGYADYTLSDNTEYDLSIAATSTRVTGLRTASCTDASGNAYSGSIRLEFKQP